MGSLERRNRHKEELRRRILDAARELFSTEGVERVSMRRIAERIEYSPKTLYLYFRDKGEILYHLCEESFQKLDEMVCEVIAAGGELETVVRRLLRTYVEYAVAHPHDYRIAFLSDAKDYPFRTHDELPPDSVSRDIHTRVGKLLAEGMDRGIFRRMEPIEATYILWAGVHGVALALICDPHFKWVDRERFIDQTIACMVQGLKLQSSTGMTL